MSCRNWLFQQDFLNPNRSSFVWNGSARDWNVWLNLFCKMFACSKVIFVDESYSFNVYVLSNFILSERGLCKKWPLTRCRKSSILSCLGKNHLEKCCLHLVNKPKTFQGDKIKLFFFHISIDQSPFQTFDARFCMLWLPRLSRSITNYFALFIKIFCSIICRSDVII